MKKKQSKFFYGWYIVIAGILLNSVGLGVIGTKGIFFADIMQTLEVNQTQVSMIVMFITLGTLIGGALAGKIIAKFGERKSILIFGVSAGLLMGMLGVVTSLMAMYVVAIVAGIAIFVTSVVTVPALITSWFEQKRGLAIGLVMAGSGLSQILMAPYLAPVIGEHGYQTGYIHLAVIMLVITLTAVALIKNKPENIGLKAYGAGIANDTNDNQPEQNDSQEKSDVAGVDFKAAIKSPSFLFFAGFGICSVFLSAGISIQVASYLAFEGISPQVVGLVIAGFGVSLVLGKIIAGFVFDKLGIFAGNIMFFALGAIALFSLLLVPDRTGLILYMIFGGAGFGFSSVSNPIMVSTMYGGKAYSQILSIYMLFYSLGAVLASLLSGVIIDAFGFNALVVAGAVAAAAGCLCSCVSLKLGKAQQKKSTC